MPRGIYPRKKQAKLVDGTLNRKTRKLKRAKLPFKFDEDGMPTVPASPVVAGSTAREWREMAMAQQGTIARLLTIIEAVVELN
jgi:hypothetical protein